MEITNQSKLYPHNWFNIFPFFAIQHKYWYLWTINFGWLWFDWTFEFCKDNWNKNSYYCIVQGYYSIADEIVGGMLVMSDSGADKEFEIALTKDEYTSEDRQRFIKEHIAADYNISDPDFIFTNEDFHEYTML